MLMYAPIVVKQRQGSKIDLLINQQYNRAVLIAILLMFGTLVGVFVFSVMWLSC